MVKRHSHELDSPPWERFAGTLMSAAGAVRNAFDVSFEELGLSLPEASILAFVSEAGPVNQSVIASKLDAGRAATGLRVDALESRQLVRRLSHPTDRRVWLIEITDVGRSMVDRISEIDEEIRAQLREGVTKVQRRQLAEILDQIRSNALLIIGTVSEGRQTTA
jgi:DNA-binding MarR family transcriptional regulator